MYVCLRARRDPPTRFLHHRGKGRRARLSLCVYSSIMHDDSHCSTTLGTRNYAHCVVDDGSNKKVLIFHTFLLFNASFANRLDDHLVISHHYPKDAYRCELCPRAYCYRPSLLRHRAIVHGEIRRYPCENCPKVSDSVSVVLGLELYWCVLFLIEFDSLLCFFKNVYPSCTMKLWKFQSYPVISMKFPNLDSGSLINQEHS